MKVSFRLAAAAGVAALALGVSACGSSGSTDSTSTNNSPAATPSASVPAPPTTPPTAIPVTQPLGKKPPTGKTFIWLQCSFTNCALQTPGIQQAAAALGWKVEVLPLSGTNPAGSLDTAIQKHPDYIGMSGIPTAAIGPQLKAAHAAGIPVLSCGTTDKPSATGYVSECGGTLANQGNDIARWVINDSHGAANVVIVNIPQYTSLTTVSDAAKQEFSAKCSGCTTGELNVTPADLGSGVTQKVVAYIQTHPNTNYVLVTLSDLGVGLPQVLRSSGYGGKVKVVGTVDSAAIVKGLETKDFAAWTMTPKPYEGATMIDTAARLALGQKLSSQYQSIIYSDPTWVVDSPASAQTLHGGAWAGPANYLNQFKMLWGVG